jgi:ABC-type nitrate/sulfonate/bicarbonate transport system permease component
MNYFRFERAIYALSSIAIAVIFWHIVSYIFNIAYIPSPIAVGMAFMRLSVEGDIFGYTLFHHSVASLIRIAIGLFFAVIIGIPLGIIIGLSERVSHFVSPIVEIIRPISPIAWIPFSIILFGIGLTSHAFIIWLGAFFPILLNTYGSMKGTSQTFVEVAKSMGASKLQTIRYVIFPGSLPDIITGFRIGLGVGWMCLIASEMVGQYPPLGLGFLVLFMAQIGRYPSMIAGMLTIGFFGILLNYIILFFETKLFKWREKLEVY